MCFPFVHQRALMHEWIWNTLSTVWLIKSNVTYLQTFQWNRVTNVFIPQNNQRKNPPLFSALQRLFKRKQKIKSMKKVGGREEKPNEPTHTHSSHLLIELFCVSCSVLRRAPNLSLLHTFRLFQLFCPHTHIHMLIRIKRKYTNGNGVLKKSTKNISFLRHNLQYFLSLSSFLFGFVLFCKFQWRLVNFSRQLSCVAIVGSSFFTLTWWSWRVSKREKSAYIRIQCGGKPFVVRFKAVCYVDPFIEAMNLIACCFDFDAAREKLGRKMRTNYETPNVCIHAK